MIRLSGTLSGGQMSYTVERLPGDVMVVTGAVPIRDMLRLLKDHPEDAVQSLHLGDILDATLVVGSKTAIDALHADPPPPRGRRAGELARVRSAGLSDAAVQWVRAGQLGLSSRALFGCTTGVVLGLSPQDARAHPRDPDDLSRCVWLVRAVPEAKAGLHKAASMSPAWRALVEHWDELDAFIPSFEQTGAPEVRQRLRACAERMHAIYEAVEAVAPDDGSRCEVNRAVV